jgi:hypothetical protein
MRLFRYKKEALAIVGGLSHTTKMPCPSWGTPAAECPVGQILRPIEGSTCFDCYALKGRCSMPNSTGAQYRRLEALNHPDWIAAMVHLIIPMDHFRWSDTGDLMGAEHLDKIVDVCYATPDTQHWLPTREYKLLKEYAWCLPDNLTVRVSAPMIDGAAPEFLNTSTVHKNLPAIGVSCPAIDQGGKCEDCRMCWDKEVKNVSYNHH